MAIDSSRLDELNSSATLAQGVHIDALDDQTMVVNMGPQHPSTHGVLRVVLELDGEIIARATPHIGYVHTGIEKTIEYNTYMKAVTLTDRMDYVSAHINNAAYTLAVEQLLGIEPPPRGQYLRVMLMEIQRIASHLVWLGTHCLDIGAMTIFFYAFQQREELLDMTEMMAGVRMMPSKTVWRSGSADRRFGRPGSTTIFAKRCRTAATISSTSMCPLASTATSTTGIACGWPKCTRAARSSSSASRICPPARSMWTTVRSFRRRARNWTTAWRR
jgi:hypothetical protein